MSAFINPSVSDFKSYFVRDFPFGTNAQTTVIDQDVMNALGDMAVTINPALFSDQNTYFLCALNLAAHMLVMNLRASSQGMSGQFGWLQQSKGVGGVSESFAIPQRVLDNPTFAWYSKSNYGAKYLSLLLPLLAGNYFSVMGRTNA
jgi:hypothetical protein